MIVLARITLIVALLMVPACVAIMVADIYTQRGTR